MVVETTIHSEEYLQLKKYFKQLYRNYYVPNVEGLINRYKIERAEHNKKLESCSCLPVPPEKSNL